MEPFGKKDREVAEEFFEFYKDLVENHLESLQYSLADGAVLDWFGRTVKGDRKITAFLREKGTFEHFFKTITPKEKIGFRNTHVVAEEPKILLTDAPLPTETDTKTPPNKPETQTSGALVLEQGQGDGLHNCDLPISPMKRFKKSTEDDEEKQKSPVRYLSTEGHLEFRKKSSKKYQTETKFKRPCKLEIAYSTTNIVDSTVHLIIYSNEMKCRRNLMRDFDVAMTSS